MTGVIEHTSEFGGSATLGGISAFGRDSRGEIYIVSYAGTIFKIVDPNPPDDVQAVLLNFNGDALKDVLLYNRGTGAWTIQIGTNTGEFTQAASGGWAMGWQIFVADFNADGLDDLFLYSAATGVWFKVNNTGSAFLFLAGLATRLHRLHRGFERRRKIGRLPLQQRNRFLVHRHQRGEWHGRFQLWCWWMASWMASVPSRLRRRWQD